MLQPQDRRLLMEALRPPPGMQLDYAIGTTFSLDLVALLVTPLAFTFFDWETADGQPTMDPVALLQAIRRNADRIAVFCQAGEIKVPPREQRLFAYLEDCVHEVTAPSANGVFHPKVWVLRFVGGDTGVMYRVICASRNITFDRSWDTLLVLDGHLRDRLNAFGMNHPLGDFVKHLPHMTLQALPASIVARIEQIQHEIRRVEFDHPEGMTLVAFWPLGIPGHQRWPFANARDRFLVISPFLAPGTLVALTPTAGRGVLVSRADSLSALAPELLARFEQVLVFDPAVDDADVESELTGLGEGEPVVVGSDPADDALRGLHAKLFVADDGWNARVWTGSANATQAAFQQNVEFLVELQGKRGQVGVDAVLGTEIAPTDLRKLLQPYTPIDRSVDDAWQQRFDREALQIRLAVARAGLAAHVTSTAEKDVYGVKVVAERPETVANLAVELTCWPITCNEALFAQQAVFDKGAATTNEFARLSIEGLTPFFAFCARIAVDDRVGECRFVLKLPLNGAPADRREHLLRYVIRNQREFMAYLLMLLAVPDSDQLGDADAQKPLVGSLGWLQSWGREPVFESLVRCLDRSPHQLDEVARLIEDLRATEAGRGLIPMGFDTIWAPIWTARQSFRKPNEDQPR